MIYEVLLEVRIVKKETEGLFRSFCGKKSRIRVMSRRDKKHRKVNILPFV